MNYDIMWLKKKFVAQNCLDKLKENVDIDEIKYNEYRYKLKIKTYFLICVFTYYVEDR